MTFFEAINECSLKKPFTFSGRATQSEFWWYFLFTLVLTILLLLIGGAIFEYTHSNIGFYIVSVGIVYLFIAKLSVSVRRLHDTGKSGAWYFISLIPYIGGLILLYLLSLPSEQNENKYGSQNN